MKPSDQPSPVPSGLAHEGAITTAERLLGTRITFVQRCVHAALRAAWHLGLARYPEPLIVDVEYCKPHRLAGSSNVWVLCLSGTAWLTRDGCPTDTILARGDAQRVSPAEAPLVVGMPRCRLRIVAAHGQLIEPLDAVVPGGRK